MRSGTYVEDVRRLKPWNEEMSTFADGFVDDTAKTIEQDGALAAVDGVEGGVGNGSDGSEAEGGACEVCEEGNGCLIVRHC